MRQQLLLLAPVLEILIVVKIIIDNHIILMLPEVMNTTVTMKIKTTIIELMIIMNTFMIIDSEGYSKQKLRQANKQTN